MTAVSRRNLVVVRAGDKSLHPAWLAGPEPRNWDIVVNYFGDDPHIFRTPEVVRIDGKGPKWPALQALFMAHPDLVERYDHIWLPDDDLATDTASINRLFETCARHRLEVAQPALTWDSYFGHLTTLRNPLFRMRMTNYVEVMAPCMTAAVLRATLPLFNANLSGWGLDFIWPRHVSRPDGSIAIIDDITVTHTRPVGGPNYKLLREGGISPWDELRRFCAANGIESAPRILTHRAVMRSGRMLAVQGRERRFALMSVIGLAGAVLHSPERRRMLRRMAGMLYKSMMKIPDQVSETPLRAGLRPSGFRARAT